MENDSEDRVDRKYSYACDLLSNGLILLEFIDAVREGDGKKDYSSVAVFDVGF